MKILTLVCAVIAVASNTDALAAPKTLRHPSCRVGVKLVGSDPSDGTVRVSRDVLSRLEMKGYYAYEQYGAVTRGDLNLFATFSCAQWGMMATCESELTLRSDRVVARIKGAPTSGYMTRRVEFPIEQLPDCQVR